MNKRKVLFLYPFAHSEIVAEVYDGTAPKERLYGMYELRERGWQVSFNDSRFFGLASLTNKYTKRFGVECLGWNLMRDIFQNDIVIVKDEFSITLTLFCKLLGKPVIYFDSLFDIPQRILKKALLKLNIKLASRIICYSDFQKEIWTDGSSEQESKFSVIPFAIDEDFYEARKHSDVDLDRPYILAVGRDLGRDYTTLVTAASEFSIRLKLVTLPYLLVGIKKLDNNCDVYQNLSYDELFGLYAGALAAVIPLKKDIQYPSGVRGALEAMSLGKPVIMTKTPVMEEYFKDGTHLLFIEPESPAAMVSAIKRLGEQAELREALVKNAKKLVKTRYQQSVVINKLEAIIENC